MSDDLPQNIYDDPAFFAGYSQMARFQSAWGTPMEHSVFERMMGDVAGRRVLDLGCGGGQLAFHLAERGAASVFAIDASERMLEVASTKWSHPNVTYRQQTMEEASFPGDAFDLVVSSLAFHYVRDYTELLGRLSDWLRPGGLLVFSTEHPIYAARSTEEGWVIDSDGTSRGWAIDDYADEGVRERNWFVPGVRRYHRTFSTILNGLIGAGLTIECVAESWPDEAWLRGRPQDAEERRRPMFLLVQARKAGPTD